MNTIYKYPIKIRDVQEIQMQRGAEVLHVGLDPQGTPCLWAKVESSDISDPIRVFVVGTGEGIPFLADRHAGSFVQDCFVWHVFLGS